MKNFILGSIFTFLVVLCAYFYFENTSLTASLNTYRNNKEVINKDFQKAKEDFYIQQQSDNTSLVLFTVTALFGLFSFFTFTSVKRMFDVNIAEIKNKYDEQITKYEESIIHINNLKSGFSFQHANNLHADFKKLLSKSTVDVESLVELGIVVCEHYCYAVGYSTVNTPKFDESISIIVSSVIDKMLINIENYNEVKLINMDYIRFINAKKAIEVMIDEENMKRFSKITSKLSFPTLD